MLALFLVSGIIDYKYRRIPNTIILLILSWALLFSSASIFERIVGFLITAIPLLIFALTSGKLKGGDYKFLVVCALALGGCVFIKTLFFTVIVAMGWSIMKRQSSVPLAYVFFIGYVITLIIQGGQI